MQKGEMLSAALLLATNAHAGQFDKGGNPYILHPLKVMHYLRSEDEELQCVAVLHDVLEDTNTSTTDLFNIGMTDRVVTAVLHLTKRECQLAPGYKEQVFASKDAMLVKLADLRHNSDIRRLKGVSEKDIERMTKYHKFYLEIQQRLNNE